MQQRLRVFDEIGPDLGRGRPEARLAGFLPLRTSIARGLAAAPPAPPRPARPGLASERRGALAAMLQQELLRRLGPVDEACAAALLLQSRIDADSCLDAPLPATATPFSGSR